MHYDIKMHIEVPIILPLKIGTPAIARGLHGEVNPDDALLLFYHSICNTVCLFQFNNVTPAGGGVPCGLL